MIYQGHQKFPPESVTKKLNLMIIYNESESDQIFSTIPYQHEDSGSTHYYPVIRTIHMYISMLSSHDVIYSRFVIIDIY